MHKMCICLCDEWTCCVSLFFCAKKTRLPILSWSVRGHTARAQTSVDGVVEKHQIRLINFYSENSEMRRFTTGILSEKCVVRRFRRCTNVIGCTNTNLVSTTYHTPSLHGIANLLSYQLAQHVTVLNTVGNFNTMLNIIL